MLNFYFLILSFLILVFFIANNFQLLLLLTLFSFLLFFLTLSLCVFLSNTIFSVFFFLLLLLAIFEVLAFILIFFSNSLNMFHISVLQLFTPFRISFKKNIILMSTKTNNFSFLFNHLLLQEYLILQCSKQSFFYSNRKKTLTIRFNTLSIDTQNLKSNIII